MPAEHLDFWILVWVLIHQLPLSGWIPGHQGVASKQTRSRNAHATQQENGNTRPHLGLQAVS